jgi:LPPG:FO 2-phospho-L-lactate transferase
MDIVALAGGVGASKLLAGLNRIANPHELTIVVNTGDDLVLHGLAISPDLDIVTYTLAGQVNPETGWGFRDETFRALDQLAVYGHSQWFHLGDRDLATHIHRTELLRGGASLSAAADSIRQALGVTAKILPMSDQAVPTIIETDEGRLNFQEYLVEHHAQPRVRAISFDGVEAARPAPGVLEALERACCIVICPSNPLISIGPILAVPGIRNALRTYRGRVIAVCPIVGGKSLKGPSDRMLEQLGYEVSPLAIAQMYKDFCGTMVIDTTDSSYGSAIESLEINVIVYPTVMRTARDKELLARRVLEFAESRQGGVAA